jgi:fatty-acid desaturase
MNLGRRMVHQPYHGSLEIIHDPNHQVHHNPRVLDHILLVIDYRKASQSYYKITTIGKLNADWSNKQYLQHNKSSNKAILFIIIIIILLSASHTNCYLYAVITLIIITCLLMESGVTGL